MDCDGKHAFSIEPLNCGLAEPLPEEFRIYDYLGLGVVKSKMQEMVQSMVSPVSGHWTFRCWIVRRGDKQIQVNKGTSSLLKRL